MFPPARVPVWYRLFEPQPNQAIDSHKVDCKLAKQTGQHAGAPKKPASEEPCAIGHLNTSRGEAFFYSKTVGKAQEVRGWYENTYGLILPCPLNGSLQQNTLSE